MWHLEKWVGEDNEYGFVYNKTTSLVRLRSSMMRLPSREQLFSTQRPRPSLCAATAAQALSWKPGGPDTGLCRCGPFSLGGSCNHLHMLARSRLPSPGQLWLPDVWPPLREKAGVHLSARGSQPGVDLRTWSWLPATRKKPALIMLGLRKTIMLWQVL